MKKKWNRNSVLNLMLLVLVGFLSACNPRQNQTEQINTALTLAAQTQQSINQAQTQIAVQTLEAIATQAAAVTPTPTETLTFTPTATLTVTPTAIPPTLTPTPTVTDTQLRCNWAEFVTDVSIPDGTKIEPGASFTKTWRLKNIGSCTWTTSYDLVFVSGQALDAPTRVGLPTSVAPGQTIDLSLLMEAPTYPGTYTGYWILADADDNRFGYGPRAAESFWVKIKVDAADEIVYNFARHVCDAAWRSGTTHPLPCPGDESDNDIGYVVSKENPLRESGGIENELSLVTSPDNADEGIIYGIYPAFTVQSGDLFKTVVGCEFDSPGCDVIFELRYQINGGTVRTLASWHEVDEGQTRSVTVNLSDLAGYKVTFILTVRNNGTSLNNRALWILPRIMR
jgi:hypothetical protein